MTISNGVQEESRTLQAIRYSGKKLELLDQRKLPHESIFLDIPDSEAAWHAIKDMVVRGAPAIAISAALALAVELQSLGPDALPTAAAAEAHVLKQLDYLVSSRPTAVNLSDAASKLKVVAETAAAAEGAAAATVVQAVVAEAEAMLREDAVTNKKIGRFGADAIVQAVEQRPHEPLPLAPSVQTTGAERAQRLRVLTHCNTGSLACAAFGTALGVIRTLHADGRLEKAVCTETRPYNQGSRLTAFELVHDHIPATLIADSAAAYLQATGGIDAVVVGADRVAANGDTANKVGTYSLALASARHGIPFFVAAPTTSIDLAISSGRDIVVEERDPRELTHALGGRGPQVAPDGIHVWNPSFDITPADVIAGIITEKGVVWREKGAASIDLPGFLGGWPGATTKGAAEVVADGAATPSLPRGGKQSGFGSFRRLDEPEVAEYVAAHADLVALIGGQPADWSVAEVGDGNINFVYVVQGPAGAIVVKQALPYIRCVGETWPMSLTRINFEATALQLHAGLAPDLVPEVYLHDPTMATIAMEYLAPPHIILRKGLIAGLVYPRLADHISTFLARSLFSTSLLSNSTATFRAQVAVFCGNVEMCRLTEQVIFTEPYRVVPHNRWTSPQLDEDALAVREDEELKIDVAVLKRKFCQSAEALLHGDLHTGSIMAHPESTKVIDPEFAFYGPMGFDLGAFLGNLLLAYFSQDGHGPPGSRAEYKAWILGVVMETWTRFDNKFRALWSGLHGATRADPAGPRPGEAYVPEVYGTPELLAAAQGAYMRRLLGDTLGFAGAKMIRRIVGIAHVEDLESIVDADVRAKCERRALNFGKLLVKRRRAIAGIHEVVALAESA